MTDIKKTITQALADAIKEVGAEVSVEKLDLEHPAVASHGDYSSNVALQIFGEMKVGQGKSFKQTPGLRKEKNGMYTKTVRGSNPREITEQIVKELSKDKELGKVVEKIAVAGPGFINFWLTKNSLIDELKRIKKEKSSFGKGESLKGKKIMVEFTDPNPFKEFHIGHLFSNTVGESLSRLFESQGALVKRVNYQGDVGMHVAKSVWGMLQLRSDMPSESASLSEKAKFMGRAYAVGATKFEEDEQVKKEITQLNKKIYEQDPEVMMLYNKGRKWSLDYFETIYKRLGTKFGFYYFESQAGKVGLEIVKENLKKGIFVESEGAIVYPGEKYGLHRRVFVNSLGLPTYEAKDLGLAPTKYKDFPYDESVIVTGNEINEYFRVVISALKQITPELGTKAHHLSHGMVRLPEGKMSSRTGKVLTGEWLLDEVKKLILGRMAAAESDISADNREVIADQIAVGAIKYALLKAGIGHDVIFDLEKSVSIEGNSGPYLQYTFARTQSVLEKSPAFACQSSSSRTIRSRLMARSSVGREIRNKKSYSPNYELLITNYSPNPEELAILRWIYRFPEVVAEAATQYAPNLVCTFLYELAQRFNTFYNKHRILEGNRKQETRNNEQIEFRLLLTAAAGQTLKNGLNLLGIQSPERM